MNRLCQGKGTRKQNGIGPYPDPVQKKTLISHLVLAPFETNIDVRIRISKMIGKESKS